MSGMPSVRVSGYRELVPYLNERQKPYIKLLATRTSQTVSFPNVYAVVDGNR